MATAVQAGFTAVKPLFGVFSWGGAVIAVGYYISALRGRPSSAPGARCHLLKLSA